MRGISIRLVAGHVLVAVVAVMTTFLIVRGLAPALFDEELRLAILAATGRDQDSGRVPGVGLRGDFALAVDRALLFGALVGVAVAALAGIFVAARLGGSLHRVSAATRRIAAGDYGVRVPVPPETELAVIAETKKLRRLSDDLSTLSRAEEGRLTVDLRRLDLSAVVEEAVERLRPQCEDAGLDLSLDLAPEPVEVEADPDRIAQVATNLVGNALRATDSGGSIVVATRSTPTGAAVTVTDTGEGLEPDQLEKVFERFYRVPGRRAPGSEVGSGIGLTIARGIARLHGGELVASSPGPGRGATFTLTLPGIRTASGGPGS